MKPQKITRAEFVELTAKVRLTDKMALFLRLRLGLDDVPYPLKYIADRFGKTHQNVSDSVCSAIRRIGHRVRLAPWTTESRTIIASVFRPYNPRPFGVGMTLHKAERIIGGSVVVTERDEINTHGSKDKRRAPRIKFYRVACIDANGKVIEETARELKQALELLVRANYSISREYTLRRDSYRCTNCGSLRNLQCDHKESRSRGERCDRPENLVTLCAGCHQLRHKVKDFHDNNN